MIEEWNAALEAAAKLIEETHQIDGIWCIIIGKVLAGRIRALKREQPRVISG